MMSDDDDDEDDEVWSTMIQGPLAKACGRTLLWTKMAPGLPYDSKCCLHLLAAIQINSIQFSSRNQCPCPTLRMIVRVLVVIYFQAISHFQSQKTSASGSSRNNPRRMSASLCSRIRSPCPQRSKGLKVCFQHLLRTLHNKTIQYMYIHVYTNVSRTCQSFHWKIWHFGLWTFH